MSHKFIVSAIAANEVSEHVQQLQSVYSCSDLSAKGQGTVSERQLASCAQWFPVGFMAAFVLKQIICVDNPSQWLQNYRFLIRLSLPNCQIQHFLVCLKLGHSHVMKKWWSIKTSSNLPRILQSFSDKAISAISVISSERPHPHLHRGQHPEFLLGDVSEHRHLGRRLDPTFGDHGDLYKTWDT